MNIASQQHRVVRLDNARYYGKDRLVGQISGIVTHCTYGGSFASSVRWMNSDLDPDGATGPKHPSSYGYGVERDGSIIRMTPPEKIAYHAGDSGWPHPRNHPPGNRGSVNGRFLGIAFALERGESPTELQVASSLWLHRFWMNRCGFGADRVRGHFEVSPGRKTDPVGSIDMGHFRWLLSKVVLS